MNGQYHPDQTRPRRGNLTENVIFPHGSHNTTAGIKLVQRTPRPDASPPVSLSWPPVKAELATPGSVTQVHRPNSQQESSLAPPAIRGILIVPPPDIGGTPDGCKAVVYTSTPQGPNP